MLTDVRARPCAHATMLVLMLCAAESFAKSHHADQLVSIHTAVGQAQHAAETAVLKMVGVEEPVRRSAVPMIPKVFQSSFNLTYIVPGGPPSVNPLGINTDSSIVENGIGMRQVMMFDGKIPFAPEAFIGTPLEWINDTIFSPSAPHSPGIKLNDILMVAPQQRPYKDPMFSWVQYAKDMGPIHVGTITLELWLLESPGSTLALFVYPDTPNKPAAYTINYTTPTGPGFVRYTFGPDFHEIEDDTQFWTAYDEKAMLNPPLCNTTNPSAINQTIYIFHPNTSFDIADQDVGDAQGDASFTCVDALANFNKGMDHSYAWITEWIVELIPNFGQYLNCNGYGSDSMCLGANDKNVGHEAAEALGSPMGGQCQSNPQTGEWWSLPRGGECAPGVAPGATCSWRKMQRVKTIDSKCLFLQHNFTDACKTDMRAPFPTAAKVFLNGFGSTNTSSGGCPALPGPSVNIN